MADEVEALRAKAEAKEEEFAEHQVISTAEGTVAGARIEQLRQETDKAYRRIAAARGRLTKAQKDGSAEKIAVARARLDEVNAAFEQISAANIAEAQNLVRAGLDRLGDTMHLMGEVFDTQTQVTEAMLGRRPAR
ncbi:hypothetical protein [Micromonospora haikouensis]|uniref:hypothetical protein n=1 Tax=Micromonospora haikouensis TaxID=686309 RepID=UPI003D73CD3B